MKGIKGVPKWAAQVERAYKEKVKCRHRCSCGHTMIIPEFRLYMICSHCGSKVYTKKGMIENLTKAI